MKNYELIGCPLGHSLSPVIHKALFDISGVCASYVLNEIKPENITSHKQDFLRLDGFNITIPHKQAIIPLLDKISDKAALFGAVNTVKNNNGLLCGYNTDCIGFTQSAKSAGIDIGGKVLICGSGGVSRMFIFECIMAGADVTIAVRHKDKAQKLSCEIKSKLNKSVKITDYSAVSGNYDLLINGTPSGMYPNTDECVLQNDQLSHIAAVFDAIYNPYETKLLKIAASFGAKTLNGLPMLVWQAAAAQEIWTGCKFLPDDVDKVIKFTGEKAGII